MFAPSIRIAFFPAPTPALRHGGAHRLPRAPDMRLRSNFAFEGEASETAFESSSYGDVSRHNVAVGGHNPTGGDTEMDEARVVDPYGLVSDIMSSPVQSLTPNLELDDRIVLEYLARYHGGPVVDAGSGCCVGVISRSDLHALHGETAARTVGEIMSAPPVWYVRDTIRRHHPLHNTSFSPRAVVAHSPWFFSPSSVRARAHVAEAAGMMLQHKVHRLPVVDDRNVPIGIATRTDIFEPLIAKRDDLLQDQADRRCAASRESPRRSPAPSPLRRSPDPVAPAVVARARTRAAFGWRRSRRRGRTSSRATRRSRGCRIIHSTDRRPPFRAQGPVIPRNATATRTRSRTMTTSDERPWTR